MPVKTGAGRYISFRYEPSYLYDYPKLRTDYRKDILCEQAPDAITYSDINIDGGSVVFSPSKQKAVISNRAFPESRCACLYSRNSKTRRRTELHKLGKLKQF